MTAALAATAPLLGWIIDRVSPRLVVLICIPGLAAAFLGISLWGDSLWRFQSLFALAAIIGAGTSPILYTRAVNAVFDTCRGLALGITLAGVGLMAVVLPPIMSVVIMHMGWRGGYGALAILALLPWPLVWFGLRNPEAASAPRRASGGLSREALRSRVFWTVTLAFFAIAVAVSALVVHIVPMMRDAGLSPLAASSIASLTGIGVLSGRLAIGWLIDRVFAPFVAAALFLATATGCVVLIYGGPTAAPAAAFLIGMSLGAEVDLIAFLIARYFGLSSYGVLYAFFAVGASVGPVLAGIVYDRAHSYTPALWGIVVLLAVGSLGALTLPRFDAAGKGPARAAAASARFSPEV